MSRPFEDYYANELQYLADAGRAFAERHPQEAPLLNLDNVRSRDPHVERLFENFAFLTAGIRQRLDDELPELSQSLLALLAPHYARPVPSLATVQLVPDYAQLAGSTIVDAGMQVQSVDVGLTGRESVKCTFRTCYPVVLHPVELIDLRRCGPEAGRDGLELVFELREPARWEKLQLDRIRLFLHTDVHQLVYSLHYFLTERVAAVEMVPPPTPAGRPLRIEPVGFGRGEEVIPYETHSFPGYRLLQEYFCFPQKFFYVDIAGLAEHLPRLTEPRFSVRIWFEDAIPQWWSLSRENFQQFCTPVINLFEHHAFPIDYDQRATEYPLYVEKSAPDAWQVHHVTSVVGRPLGDQGTDAREYAPFLDFRSYTGEEEAYYCVYPRYDPAGDLQCMLSLIQPDGMPAILPPQVLAVDVEAFNGECPVQLRPGDIRYRGQGMPAWVRTVRNFSTPSPVRWAPVGGETTWHLLSHLAANQLSIADVQALAGTLRLYDWTNDPANARRVEGLTDVTISDQRATIIRHRVAMQGCDVQATLDDSCFVDLGDAHLFAMVLRHFMALHSTINSFTRLKVSLLSELPRGKWSWLPLDGQQQTL